MAVAGRAARSSGCSGIPAKSISGNCRGDRLKGTRLGVTQALCVITKVVAAVSKGMFEFQKNILFSVTERGLT